MRPAGVVLAITVAGLAVALAPSCTGPPEDQARRARSAVSGLRDGARAEKWAPEEYAAATAALEKAEGEVRRQKGRFFMTRDYTKALELYARAVEDAARASDAARAGKEVAERQAREALDAAWAAIEHAQAALTIAPVSRDSRSSMDLLDAQLERAASRLEEVRNLIVAEEYSQATEKAEAILEQVTSMLRNVSRNARR